MSRSPNPYRCGSNTCSDCIFNESCANEILSDRDKGLYLQIPSEMEIYLSGEAGHDQ